MFPKSIMLNVPNLSIDQNNGDYDFCWNWAALVFMMQKFHLICFLFFAPNADLASLFDSVLHINRTKAVFSLVLSGL